MKEYVLLTSWEGLKELVQKINFYAKEGWRVVSFLDRDDWGNYHALMERDAT